MDTVDTMDTTGLVRVLQSLTGTKDKWDDLNLTDLHESDIERYSSDDDGGNVSDGDDKENAKPENLEEASAAAPPDETAERMKQLLAAKAKQAEAERAQRAQRQVAMLESIQFNVPDLVKGAMSPAGEVFCPWKLVRGYPEMYCGKVNGERALPYFTTQALHEHRVWDLYYVYDFHNNKSEPVLFVPTSQFEHLLDVINAKLDVHFTVPIGPPASKFKMTFGPGSMPRPRYLGRSASEDDFLDLTDDVPPFNPHDSLDQTTGKDERAKFHAMFAAIRALEKKKNGGENDKKKKKGGSNSRKQKRSRVTRAAQRVAWGRSIKRAQRYLGLREAGPQGADKVLDLEKPMTAAPERSALFVCIDVEAYERDNQVVTEVGVATLDTTKLVGVAPGEGGKNWFGLVEARHIIVKENTWAKNEKYLNGCPDKFGFGQSEILSQEDIPALLEEIIDGASSLPNPSNDDNGGGGDSPVEHRPVVLVFHDADSDIRFLGSIGYNVFRAANVIDIVDTTEMYRYIRRAPNQASLSAVLAYLGIESWNLHNGGNDAVYTLRTMVGLAVEKRIMVRGGVEGGNGCVAYADFTPYGEDEEGWESDEADDGGEPERPCPDLSDVPFTPLHRL
ncbi:QDE-2-interacting protein [Echria macrotheca]|uniref:QDE-2-interacting protein n=1 Tax=Echria macrotheca TaxID=438768 RepID=A0AAJ0B4W9_9PEZI|nr:QDE-2-interacting protein [Echria macrotheca]